VSRVCEIANPGEITLNGIARFDFMPLLGARRHMARAIAHLHRWPRTTCYSLLAGVGAGAGAGAAVAAAQQEYVEVPPTFNATHYPNGINANFVNGRPTEAVISDFAGPAGRFENEETRDIARAWPALVKLVRATVPLEGRVLADIGAGTGLFMAPFREAVGARGSVVAVELSPHFVKHLEAKGADYPNVSVVQCTDRSTELRDESVDVAFICDVYHHLAYPGTFMRSLHRALKPVSGRQLACLPACAPAIACMPPARA
jgi:2-polyprenyl-3-methyl-5-hydroxy-6-metoxy-1,4-benzoquinol methylase